MASNNHFGTKDEIQALDGKYSIFSLNKLESAGIGHIHNLPYSIRIILEGALRNFDGEIFKCEHIEGISNWDVENFHPQEIPFIPSRILLQDFTGVPAVVDLAALRSTINHLGGDPELINPVIPVDLVIDHSIQVDQYGTNQAISYNSKKEFERNKERYEFLKWGQSAFTNFRVVPPSTGIVHQVNLEYLANVVQTRFINGDRVAIPDTLVGTDSHTTMINSLGVVGWGVGGIEAEAAMLGQPLFMLTPEVVGFKLYGGLPEGCTATDLVLTVTQKLRKENVVGKFVEFYGEGLTSLSLEDRATISNMAPEYGATMGYFPVDNSTLYFLRKTGRGPALVDLVDRYTKEQKLFHSPGDPDPQYHKLVELDMSSIVPSLAGPMRPQDRVPLTKMKKSFQITLEKSFDKKLSPTAENGLKHGSVVIAAITSCTNTSNPSTMIAAGLLARNAVKKGLQVPEYVKTSLAPGSKVVTRYLDDLGLTQYLEELGFHTVGYGCTSCIGNSGPLPEEISQKIKSCDLVVASVLSGNRNFEGRVHPLTKMNYLASPPLVVAYALAGTLNLDLLTDPLGYSDEDHQIFLKDIWPTAEEIQQSLKGSVNSDLFMKAYSNVFEGDDAWNDIKMPKGNVYAWNQDSTYIKEPPFFRDIIQGLASIKPIINARVIALLGDSVTTDHISPAGTIPLNNPAGEFLVEAGVLQKDFNSFGSRRGNHDVMMRGTFGNIRLKNFLVPEGEGGITRYQPSGEIMSIYKAAVKYLKSGTPLIVIAGKEYGTGSSRDWAAKGVQLLGVKAVIAESYERIHRSNLVGMGVLPLQFLPEESAHSLGITGNEVFTIEDISGEISPGQRVKISMENQDGIQKIFNTNLRIDTPIEVDYYKNGGVLHMALRGILNSSSQNS